MFPKIFGLILIILGRFTADFKVCLDPKLKYLVLLELHGALFNGLIRTKLKYLGWFHFRKLDLVWFYFRERNFFWFLFPGTLFGLVRFP